MSSPDAWPRDGRVPSCQSQFPLHLAFESLTGNVRRFVGAVQALHPAQAFDLSAQDKAAPASPFVLLTYTFGRGQVPPRTARFLEAHGHLLRGVVVSGSFHWGEHFGRAGDLIAAEHRVPLIARINKSGSAADREAVAAWLRTYERTT